MPVSSNKFLDIQANIDFWFILKCAHDMIRIYIQMQSTEKYSQLSSINCSVWPNGWVFIYKISGCQFQPSCITETSDIPPVSSKKFLDIQANIECRFTLKCLCDMIRTYSEIHRSDKCSQLSWIIWSVWPNGWVLVYQLSGYGFESSCSHLNFRNNTCFEQQVPWHLHEYRVWINSETCRWHDKNIESHAPYR